MKHFIVIDMQNDFCTGALANKDAVAIIPRIKEELQKARAEGSNIIFTRDTHSENYLETGEGKHLPVKHCVKDTEGWQVVSELMEEIDENIIFIDKPHFGYDGWKNYIKPGDEVVICGTVTSICVISNALAIKAIEGIKWEHRLPFLRSLRMEKIVDWLIEDGAFTWFDGNGFAFIESEPEKMLSL